MYAQILWGVYDRCQKSKVKELSETEIFFCNQHSNEVSVCLWEFKGQSQETLSLKEVSQVQALYGIIIASWAHALCKSSHGFTLSTVSLVPIYFQIRTVN